MRRESERLPVERTDVGTVESRFPLMNLKPSFAWRGLRVGVILFAIGMACAHVIYWQRKANPTVVPSTKSTQVLEDLRLAEASERESPRNSDAAMAEDKASLSKHTYPGILGVKSGIFMPNPSSQELKFNSETPLASTPSPTATPLVKTGGGLVLISGSKSYTGSSHIYGEALSKKFSSSESESQDQKLNSHVLPQRLKILPSNSQEANREIDVPPLSLALRHPSSPFPTEHISTADGLLLKSPSQTNNETHPARKPQPDPSSQNDVTLSGSTAVNGIILIPSSKAKLTGSSTIFGEVIAKGVSLSGKSKVLVPSQSENPQKKINVPSTFPNPASTPVPTPTPTPKAP